MNQQPFLENISETFDAIERRVESESSDIDLERSDQRLILGFANDSKIIINSQPALQELWVATKSGGFHYRYDGTAWRNTRDGSELFAALAAFIDQQKS